MDSDNNFPVNPKPRRTSAFTWIALVVIVVVLLGDVLAVLLPAVEAAKEKSRQPNAAPP